MIFASFLVAFSTAVLSCLGFVWFWHRRLSREIKSHAVIKKLQDEVNILITDLNRTTERNVSLLENKIKSLKELSLRAERAGAILKYETQKRASASDIATALDTVYPSPPPQTKPYQRDRMEKNFDQKIPLSDLEKLELEGRPLSLEPKQDSFVAPSEQNQDQDFLDFSSLPIREKALLLHRHGENLDRISSRLGMSLGEIELIISLHERTF